MVIASVWALFPRQVVERVKRDGVFVYDTVTRVPLKLGLDLQGGMHLALEVDQSKQAVANVSEALDLALKVVRTRIDEFGVAEPVVQKVGDDRIIVELPGIDDQQRAEEVVQKAAFLKFQITDKTNALERVVPRLDGIKDQKLARHDGRGRHRAHHRAGHAPPERRHAEDDTAGTSSDGPFRRSITAGQMPGQYLVSSKDFPLIGATSSCRRSATRCRRARTSAGASTP